MSHKDRRVKKGIFGVRKSANKQIRPFGRYSDPFPSDDSEDSDYEPKETAQSSLSLPSAPNKKDNLDVNGYLSHKKCKDRRTLSKNARTSHKEETSVTLKTCHSSASWSDVIPSEILLQIFTYCVKTQGTIPLLCRLSKVCRRWNLMSKEPKLYKKMDLSSVGKYSIASDLLIKQLLSRGLSGAEELSLDGWIKLTEKGIQNVVKTCKNLKTLSLSSCEGLSPKFMNILANEDCTRLESMDVSATKIDHGSLRNMLTKYGKNFKELLMRNCKGFPGSILLPMIQELCPNIQHLDLSGTLVRQIKIELLQDNCPKLKTLLLANLWPQPSYIYSRHAKTSGANGFPDLEHLSLACDNQAGIAINDALITRLLKTSNKLRVLDIRGCGRVTVEAIEKLCATSLESLYLANTDASITMVTAVLNKWNYSLQYLDLGNNPIRDDTLALFQRYSLHNLKSLDLTCTGVSVTGAGYILKYCPKLEDLNLSSCRGIPRGLKQRHTGQRLARLNNEILAGSLTSQSNTS